MSSLQRVPEPGQTEDLTNLELSQPLPPHRLGNFRDLGGLGAGAGMKVKSDVVYRSDAPYADDLPPEGASAWPPGLVIDLRSSWEVERSAEFEHEWPAGTLVHRLPLLGDAAPESQNQELEALYEGMVAAAAPQLASIVTIVANATRPALIHCTAGKDRTGIAIAILLLSAGVERSSILADYARTTENMRKVIARMAMVGRDVAALKGVPSRMFAAPPEVMAHTIDVLSQQPGGARGWLFEHGVTGRDLALLRSRLVGGS
jgi:protein-tyrosine phosphatase